MKNIILLVFFCLFNLLVFSQPIISFDKTTYNFDTITFGSNGECTFKYKNIGNMPLIVYYGRADGGLIWHNQKYDTVYPKESGIAKFNYDTKRVGRFTKVGYIFSNADNGTITLTVKGYVKAVPIPYLRKNIHDFGSVISGTKLQWEFDIANHGASPLLISKIIQSKNCIANLSSNIIKSQDVAQLSMNIDTKNKSGILNEKLFINTNADIKPIEFIVKADIQYSPLKIDSIYPYKKGSNLFSIKFQNTSADTLELYLVEGEAILVKSDTTIPTYFTPMIYMIKRNTTNVKGPYDDRQLILPYEKGELSYDFHNLNLITRTCLENKITFSSKVTNNKTEYKNVAYIKF